MHSFIENLLFFKKTYTKKIEINKVIKLKKINQVGKTIPLKKQLMLNNNFTTLSYFSLFAFRAV